MERQERTGTVLTVDDHEHFIEHGYVVVRRAVPPEVIDPVVRLLDEAQRRSSTGGNDDVGEDGRALLERCVSDRVHDAIAELFGPDYSFSRHRHASDMPRVHNPSKAAEWSSDGEGGAHIDQHYATLMPDTMAVRVFIFLTKVRHRGGAFMHAPGSYRVYRAIMQRGPTTPPYGEGPLMRLRADDPDYRAQPVCEYLAEPGDALLWHIHTGHCGSDNVVDPQTRHALSTAFVSDRRIVLGDKPLERMSTIEKTCSIRWLRHRFGLQFLTYPVPRDDQAGRELAGGFGENVLAHAETRFAGRQQRWYVTADDPGLVHHATSDNWVSWSEHEPLRVDASPITSLHVLTNTLFTEDILMAAATPDATTVLRSTDYSTWTRVATLERVTATNVFYTTSGGATDGIHFFAPDPAAPETVVRVTAPAGNFAVPDLSDPQSWDQAVAASAPGPVDSVAVWPTTVAAEFAMVMNLRDGGLCFIRSGSGAKYEGQAQPLVYDAPTPPRAVRVYEQGRLLWVVTYLRDGHVFWGAIDWDEDPPKLRELSTPDAFERALQTVGLV